jgi:hypothetical protein
MDKKEYAIQKHAEMAAMLDELARKLASSEEVGGYLNKRIYAMPDTIPCKKWSAMNQLMVMLAHTIDARGYNQWQQVGRQVKRGAKAIHILVPCIAKKENEAGEVEETLRYYKAVPIFTYEDTEGEELEYMAELRELEARPTDALPLREVAEALGVQVKFTLSAGAYEGKYKLTKKAIELCTDEEQVFFHELAHAVDHSLGNLKPETVGDPLNEVVAEFTACFLASRYGRAVNMLDTREYIAHYSGRAHVAIALSRAMERTIAIIEYIQQVKAAAVAA